MPEKQIPQSPAEPFIHATGVNVKTGTHPVTAGLALLGEHHLPAEAERLATEYLRRNAQKLRKKGFIDPAIRLFEDRDGNVQSIVFDTGKDGTGAVGTADKLLPEGAEPYKQLIFTPTGY